MSIKDSLVTENISITKEARITPQEKGQLAEVEAAVVSTGRQQARQASKKLDKIAENCRFGTTKGSFESKHVLIYVVKRW